LVDEPPGCVGYNIGDPDGYVPNLSIRDVYDPNSVIPKLTGATQCGVDGVETLANDWIEYRRYTTICFSKFRDVSACIGYKYSSGNCACAKLIQV
jgi:hypothetical protein